MLLQDIPSAWKAHALFATTLVKSLDSRVIVDLGVDYGYSTICLAANPKSTVYGMDWFKGDAHTGYRDTMQEVKKNLLDNSISNVHLIRADFDEIASIWNKQIDILHIDGSHHYEDVKRDFFNWAFNLHKEGVILLHDTLSFPDTVGKFFNEIPLPKFNIVDSAGLGVVCRNAITLERVKQIYAVCE